METIIVTGAHGFLGRHVTKQASKLGNRVVGVGHGEWVADEWRPWGLTEWLKSDITVDSLRSCAPDAGAIIHLAGGSSVPFSMEKPREDFHRTVETTANVMEFARTQPIKPRVVYCSSASVYGTGNRMQITEDRQPNPISPYGVHKYLAEQVVASYAQQYEIPSAIVRLFSVYGCGLRKQLLWDASTKIASGNAVFMGSGLEARDWLHVSDAASLLLLTVSHCSPGCPRVNGGTGKEARVVDIVQELSKHLGVPPQGIEFSGRSRTGDPEKLVADVKKALSWGWLPKTTWQEGVAEYANWWLEEQRMLGAISQDMNLATNLAAGGH